MTRRSALARLARPKPGATARANRGGSALAPQSKAIYSLLYTSDSRIAPSQASAETDRIVGAAISRNDAMAITGSLIFTGARFAQVLEGSRFAVDSLMTSIRNDRRHTTLVVMRTGYQPERRFASWGMAYSGTSPMVAGMLVRAATSARLGSGKGVSDLLGFMERFAARSRRRTVVP